MTSQRTPPKLLQVRERLITLCGWPTDSVEMDYYSSSPSSSSSKPDLPHTIVVFFPGNPGCIGWYTSHLQEWVHRLGRGFASRGLSYAGHSPNPDLTNVEGHIEEKSGKSTSIPWSLEGQIQHKIAYVQSILDDWKRQKEDFQKDYSADSSTVHDPRLIFMSHSIGGYMIQQVCLRCPDVMERTIGIVHLMPFIRMDPDRRLDRFLLGIGAEYPYQVIAVAKTLMHLLRWIPRPIFRLLAQGVVEDPQGRELAINMLRQPTFARNFMELGKDELNLLPRTFDVSCIL